MQFSYRKAIVVYLVGFITHVLCAVGHALVLR